MEQNPVHYDGRGNLDEKVIPKEKEVLEITDEMRKNISGNPFELK
ncbi:hypothetical protein [Halobacillus salinarum]|nr:hypothetical protein [Halobacillus salinarum]